jgi:hypothetical protein
VRSAGGEGWSPFSRNFAQMNRSIGERDHSGGESLGSGGASAFRGRNDHHSRSARRGGPLVFAILLEPGCPFLDPSAENRSLFPRERVPRRHLLLNNAFEQKTVGRLPGLERRACAAAL